VTRARLDGLDGLRGIASLIVVFRHTSNAIAMPMELRRQILESPLAILLNAQGAVQLFFVLSGFVLTASIERAPGWRGLSAFLPKRILRIHLPYVGTVLLCFALSFLFVTEHADGLTAWIERSARVRLTGSELGWSLLFPGRAYGLIEQGWTLTAEMVFSLALPALILIARKTHWIVLIIASALLLQLPFEHRMFWYAIDFSFGMALWLERDRIHRLVVRVPPLGTVAWVALGIALWAAPMLLGWHHPVRRLGLIVGGMDPRSIVVMGVGAALLIPVAVDVPWWRNFLSSRPVAFLGKISFSLYLLHLVTITLVAPRVATGNALADAGVLFAVVLGVSIPLSWVFYNAVERPSMRAGSRIASQILGR
jgi:peptidoglycan/LPS O-acetylase OafA/YrhL